jgi:hypothetical protein
MSRCWPRSRRASRAAALAAFALLGLAPAAGAGAQALVARADTLLVAGRVFAAESLYYYAVRIDPRNPTARLALGKYLAERGALKVGAVLMEEARYFGGDAATVARELAPVYEQLGAYGALASLPESPLPYGERLRAEWLRDHPPTITGPDSGVVAYHVSDGQLLGRVMLHIGADSVLATIDARVRGLVLDTAWARRAEVKRFAARSERNPARASAVTLQVQLGDFALTNVPTSFAPHRDPSLAMIGLDVLARLAPTFDPRVGRMTLRKGGRLDVEPPGVQIATLTNETGVYVVKTETIFPIGHPDVQRVLRYSRWTFDAKRGRVVVEEVGQGVGT